MPLALNTSQDKANIFATQNDMLHIPFVPMPDKATRFNIQEI